MGRRFKDEINYIPQAIEWAAAQDVAIAQRALLSASSRPLFAIGSGGSFTVATFAALCHEKRFGQFARAVTPLEYKETGGAIRNAAALMLSAEGKNKDILAAAHSTLTFEHVAIALTLKVQTPLAEFAASSGGTGVVAYEMPWGKDGYLATNSLIAMIILLAKAYCPEKERNFAAALSYITPQWLMDRRKMIARIIREYEVGTQVLVLFGGATRSTAIDVESKFAEAALGTCQLADYRQFAHGRHLQLSHAENAIVIAFVNEDEGALADATLALIPESIRKLALDVPICNDVAAVQGAIDAILITDVVADILGIDPGQPEVPEYCRFIHQLDPNILMKERPSPTPVPVGRKLKRTNIDASTVALFSNACLVFSKKLEEANVKALVCDFDGTFCETYRRFDGLDESLVTDIERITSYEIPIAFATGRGDSLMEDLRNKLSPSSWKHIYIGYYSGSVVARLDEEPEFPEKDPHFARLESWLEATGVSAMVEAGNKTKCGQFGLRCENHASRHEAVSAIKHWIRSQALCGWRVYCSGHSIDVLSCVAGKRKVLDFLVDRFGVDLDTEILRIGDSGDFDGNDFELLEDGLGLSVDSVSADPANCWNLLPSDRRGILGTKYYLSHLQPKGNGALSIATLVANCYDEDRGV
jgi:fructoselysine-6-P-deglycase FrlB-like protein/hydroxymethylpyrimidine pyrophosphatase-like HAD family hydrolase